MIQVKISPLNRLVTMTGIRGVPDKLFQAALTGDQATINAVIEFIKRDDKPSFVVQTRVDWCDADWNVISSNNFRSYNVELVASNEYGFDARTGTVVPDAIQNPMTGVWSSPTVNDPIMGEFDFLINYFANGGQVGVIGVKGIKDADQLIGMFNQ